MQLCKQLMTHVSFKENLLFPGMPFLRIHDSYAAVNRLIHLFMSPHVTYSVEYFFQLYFLYTVIVLKTKQEKV